ncbi:hypothetical protein SDC9_205689 [bioreactor metagenome]|uniref:Uncharacterized protein n=1 Tax=bioreactor metagenome TaxID=1076179 RepID=A0A645JEI5_9ZZZZ
MNQRFNGIGFVVDLLTVQVSAKKFTLDITDNTAAVKRKGRPDGWVQGDVEASGTITVDKTGLKAILDSANSFQEVEPFDINSYAEAGDDNLKIEAFGCKVKIGKLLDIDSNSADETEFEIPYVVTSPNFVHIDGKPYFKESKKNS